MTPDRSSWWASLRHGGLLLSPQVVSELSSADIPPLSPWLPGQLRTHILRVEADPSPEHAGALLDFVFENLCGFAGNGGGAWAKGPQVEARWGIRAVTGEAVKPRRIWAGERGALLPVFFDDQPRLGRGRGRRAVSRIHEWCRASGHQLAVLTNARQFRLVFCGGDHHAFAEWDTGQWFEGGLPTAQVDAVRRLLAPALWTPAKETGPTPLAAAVARSRQGQAQLTGILGERVRQAVETLIQAHAPVLRTREDLPLPDVYRAANLVVMRLVVALFAEARDLFPRGNRVYEDSYGVQGLWGKISRPGARARAKTRFGAWPQVLALFRLIHDGSHHPELSMRRYGGELFRPGDPDSTDPVRRAIHVFETSCFHGDPPVMADADVAAMLDRLTRCAQPVRQGRGVQWVSMPVDFSSLSTEYIGILYEGLLDYELRQAPPDDAILFLNLGDQPALKLSALEGLAGARLKDALKELGKKRQAALGGDEGDGEEDQSADEDQGAAPDVSQADVVVADEPEQMPVAAEEPGEYGEQPAAADPLDVLRGRAYGWLRSVVLERDPKLARLLASADPGKRALAEERLSREAKAMLAREPVFSGDYYLVRWGGTRKGQGSFYTRPGLVAPTVLRTLAPLCYELPDEPSTEDLRLLAQPKPPAAILSLKVCDAGMGSASFLVSALRFIAEALLRALLHHGWLAESEGGYIAGPGLPKGEPEWFRECVRDLPVDLAAAESTIRARLKRLVVERCIYGVDLDPLAVELARLALWIETMDRDLPFGFLDHKLKCGNSLVGCWFDRFEEFPALCLNRPGDDAGDNAHTTGVHFAKGARSAALKAFRDDRLKPALARWIESRDPGVFDFLREEASGAAVHDTALRFFEELHGMPVLNEDDIRRRAEFYRTQVEPALAPLRETFDLWCALWFWPADALHLFPLPGQPVSAETRTVAEQVRKRLRFFHWELEFPDVFSVAGSGFDAMLGNPPWEVQKPSSKEFFSNLDPLYRTYGKQEALRRQRELFTGDADVEADWIDYCAGFKAMSNWCANAGFPWGDPADGATKISFSRTKATNEMLHRTWRERRATHRGYADPAHPFLHQGSADLNSYKLFLEQMHCLLREGGRLGVIVPSNVYTDKGSTNLRELFLDHCCWEWLFGFENREAIFDIHRSFKFCPIIIRKGGKTIAIRTAFMRRQLSDWENAEGFALPYGREQVTRFSPKSRSILELRSARDAEILDKMYRNGVLLGDQSSEGWGLKYAREFDMTNDSKLFPPRPHWEAQGYAPDEYGHWLKGGWRGIAGCGLRIADLETWSREPWTRARSILRRPEGLILSRDGSRAIAVNDIEDVALPLYEGRMIDHFDFSAKGWVSGKGRSAVWRDIPWENKVIEPQYLIGSVNCGKVTSQKISFLDIGSATNARSMIAAVLFGLPCGNSAPVLFRPDDDAQTISIVAGLNSVTCDFAVRLRMGGLHLNYFVVEEVPLPIPKGHDELFASMRDLALSLNFPDEAFAPIWITAKQKDAGRDWRRSWAVTELERAGKSAMSNALSAHAYGLDLDEYKWLQRDSDHPSAMVRSDDFARTLDPKGFWRVDKEKDPELRHTVLSLVALHDLQRVGFDAFLAQNDGEGWMLPETLRLADYGLGHDDRAREPQPVAARLGPRFYPWQLEGTVEESWEECRLHAANIEAIRRVNSERREEVNSGEGASHSPSTAHHSPPLPIETDLFGEELSKPKRRR